MPRTISGPELTRLSAASFNVHVRVFMEDPTGAMVDITALSGGTRNYFKSARIQRLQDQPVMSGTLTLLRSVTGLSLSPLVVASTLNRDAGALYAPFIRGGQKVRIETACTDAGVAPLAGDWKEVFTGKVDNPDWGGRDTNEIVCAISDSGGWLMQRMITAESEYGTAAGQAMETVMQAILDANIEPKLGAVTLYVPVSPATNLTTYTQSKVPVLEALRALALQIGWDVRYMYDAANVYRLTLYQPNRAKTVADYTLGPSAYLDLPSISLNTDDIRNKFLLRYTDKATGALAEATDQDAASIAAYGEKFMEVDLDATSNIDSASEATAMLAAMKSDLSTPYVTQTIVDTYFWPAELGDLVQWTQNAVHYDADQKLAVVSIEHVLEREQRRTTIQTRGAVSGAFSDWLRRQGGSTGEGPTTEPPFRIFVSKVAYNAATSKWELWYRFWFIDTDGEEKEVTNLLYGGRPASNFIIEEHTTHAAATGLTNTGSFDSQNEGWKISWDSTQSQSWDYHQASHRFFVYTVQPPDAVVDLLVGPANLPTEEQWLATRVPELQPPGTVDSRERDFRIKTLEESIPELHLTPFLLPPAWSSALEYGPAINAALEAAYDEDKVLNIGARNLPVSTPLVGRGPGIKSERIGGGGLGEVGQIYYTGTGTALTWQGSVFGDQPARIFTFEVSVIGDGQVANGIMLEFPSFSDPQKIRVANFKGFGLKVRRMHDCLTGDISIENCGWSSFANALMTGVTDGLGLEEYALDVDGESWAGNPFDTTNMSNVLRVQVEQSRFKSMRVVGMLGCVWQNIHSERVVFASWDTTAWWFSGARCDFLHGRFTGNPNINYCDDSEKLSLWSDSGTPTLTSATSIEGDVILDTLGDDSAGAFEWKAKALRAFPNTGTKNWSVVVRKPASGASAYAEFQVRNNTTATVVGLLGITWSGNTPVLNGASGLGSWDGMEQLRPLSANKFRLFGRFSVSNLAHAHEVRLFPAGNGVAATGTVQVGGIYVGNATTAEPYAKAGNSTLDPRSQVAASTNCLLSLEGETVTFRTYSTEDDVRTRLRGSPGALVTLQNCNLNGKVYVDSVTGGGGPILIDGGKYVLIDTGIDPAIPNALTVRNADITEMAVGDCGNPPVRDCIVVQRSKVAKLYATSTNAGARFTDCPSIVTDSSGALNPAFGGSANQAFEFIRCTLATPGATMTASPYMSLQACTINQALTVPSGYTLIGSGRTIFNGNLAFSGSCASLLGPECTCAGTVSGLTAPVIQPSPQSGRGGVWRKGDHGFNLGAGVVVGAALSWICTVAGGTGSFTFTTTAFIGGGVPGALSAGTHMNFTGGGTYDGSANKTLNNDGTSSNTASTDIARDANGDYAARDAVLRAADLSGIFTRRSPWCGNASLVSGTVTVGVAGLTSSMQIRFWRFGNGTPANFGHLREVNAARVTGGSGSFRIDSSSATDDGDITWEVIEKL